MSLLRRANPSLLSRPAKSKLTLTPPPPSLPSRLGDTAIFRRSYYATREHFHRAARWYQNPRLLIGIIAGGVYYWANLESVPYTNRSHFLLFSPASERWLGNFMLNRLKPNLKILPQDHPASLRVSRIANDIINARNYDPPTSHAARAVEAVQRVVFKSVQLKREMEWEVLVAQDDDQVNAYCVPGGKIVVFTGLLRYFSTDAEVATAIGHEFGHAIARHSLEKITSVLGFIVLFHAVCLPGIVRSAIKYLLELPFSRRMETEADYIGLMLQASAGYDPRVAPLVYQISDHYEQATEPTGWREYISPRWRDYFSTHPRSMKRAQALKQTEVMDKALDIYWEVVLRREFDDSKKLDS